MNTSNDNKKNTNTAAAEYECLFGKGVDLFKNYYAVLGIRNILKTIGVRTSHDSDWFKAVAEFITSSEVSELYDSIISPRKRRAICTKTAYRNPPELTEDDPDDVISYLSKNVLYRKKMWQKMLAIYEVRLEEYKTALEAEDRKKSAVEIRFKEMEELFSLSEKEVHALMAVFLSETNNAEYGDFDINRFRSGEKVSALAKIIGIPEVEAAALLDDNNNIRKYGLVDNDLDLDRTFLAYLSGICSKPLAERFWVKYEGEVLPWNFHGKLAEKHGELLKKMISAKDDNGLSVLLYGVPGSGKTSFAASLAADMGKELYFIAQNDDDSRRMSYSPAFRYAALAVAQKQLDPAKSILVIDECDKLVENTGLGGSFISWLMGGDMAGGRDGESKGQLNSVIDNNRHTILWICNSNRSAIDPSSRRRFDYNIFFDELSTTARTYIWQNALKFNHCENKLDDFFIRRISSRYPVNPGGIALAVKNTAMLFRKDPQINFEHEIMTFLKAHCSLLGIQESPDELLEPARDYSLDGLNIRSGIKLPRLIEVCRNFLKNASDIRLNRDQPRMNLLLFGVPGSGKTEFVKYLAKQLGKKLLIKNAGDLLNMYVGGTEQRIAAAFAEAELNGDILFIDEGDSLLGARDSALRSWEVSQVNTLLSEMERFKGIFIVGTNLIQKLDQAALRRFSFRLHFDYLTNDGKEIFFNTYFTKPMGLPELNEEEKKKLGSIDSMTPSDFRNVRQQFFYLADENLSNSEIIEALATEITSKTSGANYKGLGSVVNKLGF
ncbi:MAG: AAA family ATPase [Lentisphaerae bacterium]|nr:AAA family ATPase [Lentisphaerota bacterium]